MEARGSTRAANARFNVSVMLESDACRLEISYKLQVKHLIDIWRCDGLLLFEPLNEDG